MKKILSVLVVLAFGLVGVACGSDVTCDSLCKKAEKCDNGTAIESTCKSSCDHTVQAANEKGCKSEAQDLLDCADSHADTMCAGDPSTECTSENDKLDTCMGT